MKCKRGRPKKNMVESIKVKAYNNEYGCVDLNPIRQDLHNFIYVTNEKNIAKNMDKINKFISKETRNFEKKGYVERWEIDNRLEIDINYSSTYVDIGVYISVYTDHSKELEIVCNYTLYYNSTDNLKETNDYGTVILDYIKSKESSIFYGGIFKLIKRKIKDYWRVCISILGYLTLMSILYNIYLMI